MKKTMYYIKVLLFGERAQGEPVLPPTITTLTPINRPSEDKWSKEFNFGSRYGTRGSFYTN
jgi:hypothetical protein